MQARRGYDDDKDDARTPGESITVWYMVNTVCIRFTTLFQVYTSLYIFEIK
jgi:hypothetical protein